MGRLYRALQTRLQDAVTDWNQLRLERFGAARAHESALRNECLIASVLKCTDLNGTMVADFSERGDLCWC
jgi:hypothetical protein